MNMQPVFYKRASNALHAGIACLLCLLLFAACGIRKPSWPVGIYPKEQPKVPEPDAAATLVPAGYRVEVFMKDLIWPTSIDFDENGNTYVAEAGHVYGDPFAPARVLRMNADGSGLEVYAWGLRNPFGVLWGPDGQLYAADNAYDERGSRPIANAKDNIWLVRQGGWYGFPDYSSGIPVTDPQFRSGRGPKLKFLMKDHPPVEQPWMTRPENAAVTKFDFSTSAAFGYRGQMFLTEVGSVTPITGDPNPTGYTVVRIDPATKEVQPFLQNRSPGPAGLEQAVTPGPRRPVDARFSPDGNVLYIVDIGVIHAELAGAGPFPVPVPGSGVIWRITREGTSPAGPPANLSAAPPKAFERK